MRRALGLAAAAAVLAFAHDARACPRCATAVEARETAWNDRPLAFLAASAAPFAVMFGVAAWTSRLGRRDGSPRGALDGAGDGGADGGGEGT